MKYAFNPKTGGMAPKQDPQGEILKAVRRDAGIEKGHLFTDFTVIRDGLAIATENGNSYCIVRLNGSWKCIGRITDLQTIRKASYGPLVNFHLAWQSGTPVPQPSADGE